VITGSFYWSPSAAHQNDEVLLVIGSPLLAAHFTREMDRLWRGGRRRMGGGAGRAWWLWEWLWGWAAGEDWDMGKLHIYGSAGLE